MHVTPGALPNRPPAAGRRAAAAPPRFAEGVVRVAPSTAGPRIIAAGAIAVEGYAIRKQKVQDGMTGLGAL